MLYDVAGHRGLLQKGNDAERKAYCSVFLGHMINNHMTVICISDGELCVMRFSLWYHEHIMG